MPEESHVAVHLVGAGPGNPDLLTVKAHRLLGTADAVVYDRLVSAEILDLIKPGATRIYVGKVPHNHGTSQDEINALLVRLARAGHQVVRLKSGDPFIFGRGSEEAEYLARHNIRFEVVPGISAASGCAASAGIPLTHRGIASGVRFVTGHCRDNGDLDLDWSGLADPDTTLALYMGLAHAKQISQKLMAAGLAADTPVAAIAEGTTPRARICRARLDDLPQRLEDANFTAPVLILIGRVVALADLWTQTAGAETTSAAPLLRQA